MSERESLPPVTNVEDWRDVFHDEHELVSTFVAGIIRTSNRMRPEAMRGNCPTFVPYYIGCSDEKFTVFVQYLMDQMQITRDALREIAIDQRRGDINVPLEQMSADNILDDPERKLLFVVRGFEKFIKALKDKQLEGKIARAAHDVDQNAGELLPEPARSRYSNRDAPIIVLVHISDCLGIDVQRTALGSAGESQFKMGIIQIQ